MLTSVDMVNITAKINKTLNFFPFMLSLKLYEMISLCFSLLVCPSPGKANVVAIALVSQQFLSSVVSVSSDCSLLMKCKVIQSILIYMSCNHTCSRTELLERQIIYFVSSLHEMSVCILLQWELFFM